MDGKWSLNWGLSPNAVQCTGVSGSEEHRSTINNRRACKSSRIFFSFSPCKNLATFDLTIHMDCIGFLRKSLSWRGKKKSTFNYSQILPFKILTCIEVIFGIYVATFFRSKDRIRNACFFFYVELHRNTFFLSNSFHAESQSPNSGNSQPLCSISDLFCQTFCLVTRGLPSFPSWRARFPSRPSPVHLPTEAWCPGVPIPPSMSV